ncbi:MAG TPA: succinylglutamate desuccinylase/aspartoacylase family protein [Gaiellaceae bacterium]|nr:succinylglutamate desuccinylase/aspartoacylase family protein [Gaiellaceae bacterium]
MVEPRTIVFSDARLAGLEHPAFEARGSRDGPHVALIGGIHGCEYSSIAAVTRFMNELDTDELAGTITAAPVVSMQSFLQRSPFVVPEDGKNLNRCFPGTYDGTYTDALARSIFDELIAPADALIDLHGGDLVEALEPFAIYDASPVERRARALAVAFGLPYVVREDPEGGLAGMTCSAAAAAGIPAIIAEAGGRGQLEEDAVALLVRGVRNALRSLEMLPGPVESPAREQRLVGAFDWLRCDRGGFWQAAVGAGDAVGAGQLLGRVTTLHGEVLEEIHAPREGVVLFLTTSAAVSDDGLLLGLGAELEPVAGAR